MPKCESLQTLAFGIMKLLACQLLLAVFVGEVGLASPSVAQGVLDRPVTLQVTNQNIGSILTQLHKQADVRCQAKCSQDGHNISARSELLSVQSILAYFGEKLLVPCRLLELWLIDTLLT